MPTVNPKFLAARAEEQAILVHDRVCEALVGYGRRSLGDAADETGIDIWRLVACIYGDELFTVTEVILIAIHCNVEASSWFADVEVQP